MSQESLYHYAVTAHEPTGVTKSASAHFTAPNHTNLIAVRSRYLDIFRFENNELEKQHKITLNATVDQIGVFRLPENKTESIVLLTRDRQVCVLTYDIEENSIISNFNFEIIEKGKRDCDKLKLVVFKERPIFGIQVYEGCFHKVTYNSGKWTSHRYDLEACDVEDICFHSNSGGSNLELAVLHPDAREQKHVTVYEILEEAKTLRKLWSNSISHASARSLSPLLKLPGVLVFAHEGVSYVYQNQCVRMNDPIQHVCLAHCRIRPERYIYANTLGILACVMVNTDVQTVLSLEYVRLGRVSTPTSMTHLGPNDVVYIASKWGDTQLIHIQDTKQAPPNGLVRVLDEYESIAPIQDMAIVDLDRQGQCQVVTCSGVAHTGAISVLREGMGVDECARIAIPGVRGLWTLKTNYDNEYEHYLILTLNKQTRVFAADVQGLNERENCPGILMNRESLHVANFGKDLLLQIVDDQILLLRASDFSLLQNISTPVKITKAANSPTQLIVSTGEGRLSYFELSGNQLVERHSTQLPNEISCMSITPLKENSPRAELIAIGLWQENSVRILHIDGLKECLVKTISKDILPRSVSLASLGEGVPYLLVGMADGKVHHFIIGENYELDEAKRIKLGNQPINLINITIEDTPYVMALCDSPTMISRRKGKTNYVNLKLDNVLFVRRFKTKDFDDCLALYADGELIIGCGDEVKKLQIRKIPTEKFWPRRIAYFPGYPRENIVDGYIVAGDTAHFGAKIQQFELKFFDQDIEEIHSTHLRQGYAVEAIEIFPVQNGPPAIIVASSEIIFHQAEPKKGYLTIYTLNAQKQLEKISQVETKGGPNCISQLQQDYLVAGVSSNLQLYRFKDDYSLHPLDTVSCNVQNVLVEVSGNVILVGDYMMSVSVFCVEPTTNKLKRLARDYERAFCNAIQCLDPFTYISVSGEGNITVFKRNALNSDVRQRASLEAIGRFNTGLTMMNSLKKGSLAMHFDEDDEMDGSDRMRVRPDHTYLGGTVGGALLCMMTFKNKHFSFLQKLQLEVQAKRQPVAQLSWNRFRSSFQRDKTSAPKSFIDGDVVERWEELSAEDQDDIAEKLKTPRAEINRIVEELIRLH